MAERGLEEEDAAEIGERLFWWQKYEESVCVWLRVTKRL